MSSFEFFAEAAFVVFVGSFEPWLLGLVDEYALFSSSQFLAVLWKRQNEALKRFFSNP